MTEDLEQQQELIKRLLMLCIERLYDNDPYFEVFIEDNPELKPYT